MCKNILNVATSWISTNNSPLLHISVKNIQCCWLIACMGFNATFNIYDDIVEL